MPVLYFAKSTRHWLTRHDHGLVCRTPFSACTQPRQIGADNVTAEVTVQKVGDEELLVVLEVAQNVGIASWRVLPYVGAHEKQKEQTSGDVFDEMKEAGRVEHFERLCVRCSEK